MINIRVWGFRFSVLSLRFTVFGSRFYVIDGSKATYISPNCKPQTTNRKLHHILQRLDIQDLYVPAFDLNKAFFFEVGEGADKAF